MADSSSAASVISPRTEDLKYMRVSNVNVSNFVSVKLSGRDNYKIWKVQMLCLLKSQDMTFIIDGDSPPPDHYDSLVKGWILGSVSENCWEDSTKSNLRSNKNIFTNVFEKGSAKSVWKTLETSYGVDDDHGSSNIAEQDVDNQRHDEVLSDKNRARATETSYGVDDGIRIDDDHGRTIAQDVENQRLDEGLSEKNRATTTETENIRRKKKLLKAVEKGRWWEAKAILKDHKEAAKEAITKDGNTILHLAVKLGQNMFLDKLLNFIDYGDYIAVINSDKHTALQVAVIYKNKYAAELLLKKYPMLLNPTSSIYREPFLLAVNTLNMDMFVTLLELNKVTLNEFLQVTLDALIFRAIPIALIAKQYDIASRLVKFLPRSIKVAKELCIDNQIQKVISEILVILAANFPRKLGFVEAFLYPSLKNENQNIVKRSFLLLDSFGFLFTKAEDVLWEMRSLKDSYYSWLLPEIVLISLVPIGVLYPVYQLIRLLILVLLFPFSVFYFLLWKVLAIVVEPIKNIEKKKREYKEAKQLLERICHHVSNSSDYKEPLLEAARHGAFKVVDEILFRFPDLIKSKTNEEHNIIHLAIINRSEKIYNLVYHKVFPTSFYTEQRDSRGNYLMHLAGRLAPPRVLGCTTGEALQLQRELQWREEVKKHVSPQEHNKNDDGNTPEMVFEREHKDLMSKGENWMKTTAESCSITAALIVTIVFAAAITVPGGSNQDTGIPVFKLDIAFSIFAVSNAISLFTAATALLVFLSILTTRFSEQDFLISLPRRLIIGLCTLFLSTISMMVAFSAILYLVFCDQRPWMLAPIGLLACLPITAIVTLQVPLLVDLFQSTYSPIFGKQSYIERGKFVASKSKIQGSE